jgi:two-component sensor histidine kinase
MAASSASDVAALRLPASRWIIGRGTARALIGIMTLTVLGFALSTTVAWQARQARDWVGHTRDLQSKIDKIVWDLLLIQDAMRGFALDGDVDQLSRFRRFRADIAATMAGIEKLTGDNAVQQRRIGALAALADKHLAQVERVFSLRQADEVEPARALALSTDASGLAGDVAQLRGYEDALLEERLAREETFSRLMLVSLGASGALIGILVVIAAHSINRAIRVRELDLSEKDGLLAAKDLMMREIDHRARNSLHLVYSVLTFQQRRARNDSVLYQQLADAANRVLTVARVHERLYKSDSLDRIEVGAYVRDLCTDLASACLPAEAQSAIRVHVARAEISAEQAVCLGQIIVELVTNAMKFGRPTVESPVLVELAFDQVHLSLTVADAGQGLPAGFDPHGSAGLGMQVISLLIRQLHGTLEVDRSWPGARFVVTVPIVSSDATRQWIDRARRAV